MNLLTVFLSGVVIGIANIIPGVSGGTMAVVLNIFDRLVGAISDIRKNFKKNALFLLLIILGMGAGILLFASLITYCLNHFPTATNFFFVGLIAGSIPMVYKRATADRFKAAHLIPFVLAFGVMIFTVVVTPDDSAAQIMTKLDVVNFIKLLLVSILASACMIIPGISGSFVMLLLGTYTTVTTAIHSFNILILIPVAVGCVIGFVGGAKLIRHLLEKYPQATYFTILGLVIGSIPILLKPTFWSKDGFVFPITLEMLFALVTLAAGFFAAYFLGSRIKEEQKEQEETPVSVSEL